MLIRAAQGDGEARAQAVTTMPLRWDAMPRAVRSNMDFMVRAWHKDHSRVTDATAAVRVGRGQHGAKTVTFAMGAQRS